MTEIKSKIPIISALATNSALTAVEKQTLKVDSLLKVDVGLGNCVSFFKF